LKCFPTIPSQGNGWKAKVLIFLISYAYPNPLNKPYAHFGLEGILVLGFVDFWSCWGAWGQVCLFILCWRLHPGLNTC
jgi:hypothetical protein